MENSRPARAQCGVQVAIHHLQIAHASLTHERRSFTVARSLRFAFVILSAAHLEACIWFALARSREFSNDTWMGVYINNR